MAIANRYARISEITVINDVEWSARTFHAMDSSEPGQTIVDVWEIDTPNEVETALSQLRNFEASLEQLTVISRSDSGIASIQPFSSVVRTGAIARREYNVTIPAHIAPSVTYMWDEGVYGDTQWYLLGQLVQPAIMTSVMRFIFSKTKKFTVIATFSDGSSINFEFDGLYTAGFNKIDSTAQKDGKGYRPNSNVSYYSSPHAIDIEQDGGEATFVYTSVKICDQYTITSSDGGSWSGQLCYYVYAH